MAERLGEVISDKDSGLIKYCKDTEARQDSLFSGYAVVSHHAVCLFAPKGEGKKTSLAGMY